MNTVLLGHCDVCRKEARGRLLWNEIGIGHLDGWTWSDRRWRCPQCAAIPALRSEDV